MAESLETGVQAFHALMARIGKISGDTCDRFGDEFDGRDYGQMLQVVRSSLDAVSSSASAEHQAGFFRALTDLLCIVADGAGPSKDWDPLADTQIIDTGRPPPAFLPSSETGTGGAEGDSKEVNHV